MEFIDSRDLPSVGRFLALLDLEAIHLPERRILVLLFSTCLYSQSHSPFEGKDAGFLI